MNCCVAVLYAQWSHSWSVSGLECFHSWPQLVHPAAFFSFLLLGKPRMSVEPVEQESATHQERGDRDRLSAPSEREREKTRRSFD